MTGFIPFLKKELLEQLRTHRLLIVGGVFLFFGLTTPLLLKYLPDIIKLSGQNLTMEIPPPTAAESLTEYAGTISQLGILIAVLVAMGAVANEIRSGAAVITLSKQITRAAFILAKLTAMSATFLVSLIAASFICFGYTGWLIGAGNGLAFFELNLLLAVFLVFCLAVTVLFSCLFRSSLAAGGIAIGVVIILSVLSAVPVIGDYLPGKLLGWGTGLLNSGPAYWWALGITCAVIILCVYLAQRILKMREL
jgi:ABC-2 type transport system permease protein